MSYTVQQLAKLAGVSVRTLHHYDAIGLLKPGRQESNSYRLYEETELLKLQQILFYRELEFPLEEIKRILENPGFNAQTALLDHQQLIQLKRKRLDGLLKTIDATLRKFDQQEIMKDEQLYEGFDSAEMKQYAEEAKQRWGNTDAYKQSTERVAKMSKEQMAEIQKQGDLLLQELVSQMDKGAGSPEVQALIAKHYAGLRAFYEPTLELYRGLGNMYVDDPRFAAYFEKYDPKMPVFMREAMHAYCDAKEGT